MERTLSYGVASLCRGRRRLLTHSRKRLEVQDEYGESQLQMSWVSDLDK